MAWPASRAGTARRRGAHIFSVAQHSLLVEADRRRTPSLACPPTGGWPCLLHDAPEYVIGDIISPFKAVLGDGYKGVENRLLAAIHLRFGLPADAAEADLTTLAKTADRAAAFLEATHLAGFAQEEALRFFGRPSPCRPRRDAVEPWTPTRQRRVSWRGSRRSNGPIAPSQSCTGP